MDIALLRTRAVWTTNLTAFLTGLGMFGSFILIPQFVQTPESAGYGFGVGPRPRRRRGDPGRRRSTHAGVTGQPSEASSGA